MFYWFSEIEEMPFQKKLTHVNNGNGGGGAGGGDGAHMGDGADDMAGGWEGQNHANVWSNVDTWIGICCVLAVTVLILALVAFRQQRRMPAQMMRQNQDDQRGWIELNDNDSDNE